MDLKDIEKQIDQSLRDLNGWMCLNKCCSYISDDEFIQLESYNQILSSSLRGLTRLIKTLDERAIEIKLQRGPADRESVFSYNTNQAV